MKQPDPLENLVTGVEALARVRAIEMHLAIMLKDRFGIEEEETLAQIEKLTTIGRERLLGRLGHDELAIREMLRNLGIDPSPNGGAKG